LIAYFIGASERIHHMYRGLAVTALVGASQRFTVNRNQLPFGAFMHRLHPVDKAGSELLWVDTRNGTGNSVINGDAIAQVTMLLKPVNVAVGIITDLAPAFGSSDNATQGDKQNILKRIGYFR
jgi:hypothetical protein